MSLVAVAFFLPGRAKDLSAPLVLENLKLKLDGFLIWSEYDDGASICDIESIETVP